MKATKNVLGERGRLRECIRRRTAGARAGLELPGTKQEATGGGCVRREVQRMGSELQAKVLRGGRVRRACKHQVGAAGSRVAEVCSVREWWGWSCGSVQVRRGICRTHGKSAWR